MPPRQAKGRGGLNEVQNQPVATLHLMSYLAKSNDTRQYTLLSILMLSLSDYLIMC